MIEVNIAGVSAENAMEVAKICAEHPECVGCPMKVSEIVLNGARIMCENYEGNSHYE